MEFLMRILLAALFALSITSGFASKIEWKVDKISSHVFTVRPNKIHRINSTSTVIVGKKEVMVVEAQADSFLASEMIKVIKEKITKLPVTYLVYTHFHGDHIAGAGAFLREYPKIQVIAHEETKKYIQEGKAKKDLLAWCTVIQSKTEQTSKEISQAKDKNRKKYLLEAKKQLVNYQKILSVTHLICPDITFSDSLNIFLDPVIVKLSHPGNGHSVSDIILYLPSEKVLITGDLVHSLEPLFFDSKPLEWIRTLKKLEEYDFSYLIGGHGDVQEGKETLQSLINYISELQVKVVKAQKEKIEMSVFLKDITANTFESLTKESYGGRIQKARESLMSDRFIGSLDEDVKSEAESLWKIFAE